MGNRGGGRLLGRFRRQPTDERVAAFLYLFMGVVMRSAGTNNGLTEITSVRIPLADAAKLKALCERHGVKKSQLILSGLRQEINRLNKKAAKTAASV